MRKIIFLLCLIQAVSCTSVPTGSGYIQGVLDTDVLTISPLDTKTEKKTKKIALQVVKVAQDEVKIAQVAAEQASKDAKTAVRGWKNLLLLTASGAFIALGLVLLWRR